MSLLARRPTRRRSLLKSIKRGIMLLPGIFQRDIRIRSDSVFSWRRTFFLLCCIAPAWIASGAGAQGVSNLRQPSTSLATELRAQLIPREYTTLASEMAGRINKITTRVGEHFKQGDVLVEFDCESQVAQVERAKAVQMQAEKTVAINRRLVQLKSIGQLELEVSVAEYAKSQADLQIANAAASKCKIFAPFSGVAADQKVREFQYANPGQPLFDVLDDRNLDVELIVPSRWIGWLKPGYNFQFRVDELDRNYAARIVRLGGRVDPISQSIRVFGEITDAGTELMAGMSGRATIVPPE